MGKVYSNPVGPPVLGDALIKQYGGIALGLHKTFGRFLPSQCRIAIRSR